VRRGEVKPPAITDAHLGRARRVLANQPSWTVDQIGASCGVPAARRWRFAEILNQRGLVSVSAGNLAALVPVVGQVNGQTFEQWLGGRTASGELFDDWKAGK
jgi:hypothetical protein